MKANIRSRNIAVNSYVGILVITLVAGFASYTIIRIATDVPLKAYANPVAYEIGLTL